MISQFYGAKDKKNLSKALHTAFAFSIAAGIVLTVVGIFLTRPALLLMKTPADVVEDSAVYLHIYFGGMVFNLVYNMGAAILRAVGDSKRPLYVLIITCVLNIILDSAVCGCVWHGCDRSSCCYSYFSGDQCADRNSNASENQRDICAEDQSDPF